MTPIDIPTIERQARALRAKEIQRLQGLFAERLQLVAALFGSSVVTLANAVAETVRPAFSWNPQQPSEKACPTMAVRLNRAVRRLFSWNPQGHRHC